MHAPSRIFILCILGLLIISALATTCLYWHIYGFAKLFGDFNTFRSAALHAAAHQLDAVYDIARVSRLLATNNLKDFAFFLNPPTGLFIVYPLAWFDSVPALILWNIAQFALLFAVFRTDYVQYLFRQAGHGAVNTYALLGISFVAFSTQNILYGQVAVFCAALFLSVLAWRKSHPILAGIVLGIFSFKPQLGILLPLLLLAEGNWKVLVWTLFTTLVMIALSLGIWGPGLWKDYGQMVTIRSEFLTANPSFLFIISTSAYAAIRNLGASATTGILLQVALSASLLAMIWPVLRRSQESHKILMLTLCTYLVTPYSLVYDIPLLAIPCALIMRRAEANKSSPLELMALVLLVLTPMAIIVLQISHIPYSVIAIGFTLIVARILIMREQHG